MNAARYNYGYNHPRLAAITWRQGRSRDEEDGSAEDDDSDEASMVTITQYPFTGPVTMVGDMLPMGQLSTPQRMVGRSDDACHWRSTHQRAACLPVRSHQYRAVTRASSCDTCDDTYLVK